MALPAYLLAADNHNIANVNSSWLNPDDWFTKFGNIGKFAATSILSGVNDFYNSAAAAGRWFGLDIAENNTQKWIAGLDSDLGVYFRENQESVELGGFILGAIVPGLGGVKIFNAGQKALVTAEKTGKLGGNLSKATGLLVPKTQMYLDAASQQINTSLSAVKLLNANTTKAMASGLWQNTLEAAAAETLIQATMFKSPVLEEQDVGDIVSNIAIGGALGGAIGGAFTAAKLRGQLKAAIAKEDFERLPLLARESFFDKTAASDKIIALAHDSDISVVPVPLRDANGNASPTFTVDSRLYQNKLDKNFNEIRYTINSISSDSLTGNMLANASSPLKGETGYSQRYLENFKGTMAIGKLGEKTKPEIVYDKALKLQKVTDDMPTPVARWIKLAGEDAGEVYSSEPVFATLGDLYNGKAGVLKAVGDYKFSTKGLWRASEKGSKKGVLESEARYIWASKVLKQIKDGTIVHGEDLPLLERALEDGQLNIKIIAGDQLNPTVMIPKSTTELREFIINKKVELADNLLLDVLDKKNRKLNVEISEEAIARIINVRKGYLQNNRAADEAEDFFAHQGDAKKYSKFLEERGFSTEEGKMAEAIDPLFLPKYAKVVYDLKESGQLNGTVADAISYFKTKQKIYLQEAKNVVAKVLGVKAESLPDISDSALINAGRNGAGPGLISFENSNYGTIGSTAAWIGSVTRQLKQDARSAVSKEIENSLIALGGKLEAAIEFEGINQKVTRSGQLWVRYTDEDGFEYLITKRALQRHTQELEDGSKALEMGNLLDDIPDDIIELKNQETIQFLDNHIAATGKRTQNMKEIRAQQGHTDNKDPNVFRPIRPDLKNYPFFAFVRDPRVTQSGHMTMIHAASEKELSDLIDRVPAGYKVITKTDVEEYKLARDEYEYSRTLNENYINSELASKGIFSNFFPKSDPTKIVDDILQQHYRESDLVINEAVRLRYENIFNYFEDLGKTYAKTDTSRFASRADLLERTSDNPYFNIIKTALDISKAPENKILYSFNKGLDEAVSKAVASIKETFFSKVTDKESLDTINNLLDEYGIKPAYYDAALQALANHTAPRGELTKFVRRANSLLSLFTLGLDPLNALNNAIGSNILRFTELRHLTKAIQDGDGKIAGELSAIAKVKTPGVNAEIFSPTKLVSNAIRNYFQDMSEEIPVRMTDAGAVLVEGAKNKTYGPLYKKYSDMGIIKSRDDQLRMLVDDFTLKGTETTAELESRISNAMKRLKGAADKGESLTLNAQAEAFNRFISANVMEQITEIGVRNGIIDQATANAYINTFVNRVEGNIIASQRPLIFQGPIGQAISLFQSYQFNLIQQLFRYVAEGTKKDIAMLMGLQSTLYGLQSLPAFQFINTHIVGQLSGNKEHKDTYDAVYGAAGRTAGDWVLYGVPSNILQTNIYSRGDINPRQITVLPTSMQEIPIVAGWGKFLTNAFETFSKVKSGGNMWESFLQGVEHNGISRPLAGFAQVLQGIPNGNVYSTSGKGSLLYSNDLFHLSNLTRLAGGRPLDEAVTNDALFRVKVYAAEQRSSMLALAEAVKTTLIQDETATPEQINKFAEKFVEKGGKQTEFNKWMMQLYKSTNVTQAQQLQQSLNNPFAYKMQLLMGGED